jgi:mevalonate kinase
MLKKLSQFIDFDNPSKEAKRSDTPKGKALTESFDFISLIKAWKEIAGDKLSEHTIPLKNQNGTLLVLSNHSAFANELSFMELPLKKKIFSKFPNLEKSILNIKFIVDSTHFSKQYAQFALPTEKVKKQNENLLHPFSPEYRKLKKEAEQLFGDIEDAEIKEKMISLYLQSGSVKPS